MEVKKVGIAGFGFVGKATGHMVKLLGAEVVIYDKYQEQFNDIRVLSGCDFIFICVPTPCDGLVQDTSAIDDFLDRYDAEVGEATVFVIRSTVLPGTTRDYDCKRGKHKYWFLCNPEFLTERVHMHDAVNPVQIVIGSPRGPHGAGEIGRASCRERV